MSTIGLHEHSYTLCLFIAQLHSYTEETKVEKKTGRRGFQAALQRGHQADPAARPSTRPCGAPSSQSQGRRRQGGRGARRGRCCAPSSQGRGQQGCRGAGQLGGVRAVQRRPPSGAASRRVQRLPPSGAASGRGRRGRQARKRVADGCTKGVKMSIQINTRNVDSEGREVF
jgi:hypothetical protein